MEQLKVWRNNKEEVLANLEHVGIKDSNEADVLANLEASIILSPSYH